MLYGHHKTFRHVYLNITNLNKLSSRFFCRSLHFVRNNNAKHAYWWKTKKKIQDCHKSKQKTKYYNNCINSPSVSGFCVFMFKWIYSIDWIELSFQPVLLIARIANIWADSCWPNAVNTLSSAESHQPPKFASDCQQQRLKFQLKSSPEFYSKLTSRLCVYA